jgi:hypothetical protein
MRPRISNLQSASQLASATLAKLSSRFIGEAIEFALLRVPFDFIVEPNSIEFLEPRAEIRELVGTELGNCSFDLFDFSHE